MFFQIAYNWLSLFLKNPPQESPERIYERWAYPALYREFHSNQHNLRGNGMNFASPNTVF
jgi:hypothetical protein